ncbi:MULTISPECIES: glycosyltransferase [unclassified Bradyrhizobium]|uniref:glycosyltransferase family protein n=1 Tax=unclassified Bradyrhizobium TaxID=2631580 RepID=UPI002478FB24|nr:MULTISPECIES: glycosyltransferase [unclassified Bradyrhizobium]WGS22857.1 glycosyltransferase [Bradyrhizobium sp. ISRA463]WGS29851.1 glycosyltransferase [Bradyrhizobium sp. ISRA464]
MRLFQNSGLYPSYLPRLNELARHASRFEARREVFLQNRFGAPHILKPVLDGAPDAFFTNGDDEVLQRQWARAQGMPGTPPLEAILLAQIEHHGTEVFYNLDPVRYPSAFVAKLPGCVKTTLCWRAAPSGNADLTAYGAVLGNFPSILESWRGKGCRAELFFPAVDPVMEQYGHGERPIDVAFVGGYSRHHSARGRILEQVAGLAGDHDLVFCLDASRLTRLAEGTIGRLLPLGKHRRPDAIAGIARPPVFGRDLYALFGSAKIVLNGAIDMAGTDRGNMRCFEAMGCGALLLSDAGRYPDGMDPGQTIAIYETGDDCLTQIENCLRDWDEMKTRAERGRRVVGDLYGKERQWALFEKLLERL